MRPGKPVKIRTTSGISGAASGRTGSAGPTTRGIRPPTSGTRSQASSKWRRQSYGVRPTGFAATRGLRAAAAGSQSRGTSSATSGPGRKQDRTPQPDSDEDAKAYKRARRRAAREAGFYVHLMWYGIVIGFAPDGESASSAPRSNGGSSPRSDGASASSAISAACTDGDGFTSACSSPRFSARCSERSRARRR